MYLFALNMLPYKFVEKFKSTFIDKIKEMPKKLGFKKEEHEIYVGLDCPQSEIWRAKHFQEYKHGRNVEKTKDTQPDISIKLSDPIAKEEQPF